MSRQADDDPDPAPQGQRRVARADRVRRARAAAAARLGAQRGELRLHLGQPGRVARHQDGVVLVGQVARLVLAVRVVEGAPQELALVGQVPALVAAADWSGPRPPPAIRRPSRAPAPRAFSASKARLRRQKTTPTPTSAPAPSTSGMIQMSGTPPASGGTSRMVWPYSDTSTWSMSAVDRPGRHHALDLVAHGDGRRRVRLGHREVGARGAAHVGLDRGGPLRHRLGRRVEGAAPDDERHGEDDQRERHPRPQGHAGRALSHSTRRARVRAGRLQERVEVLLRGRALEHRGDPARRDR